MPFFFVSFEKRGYFLCESSFESRYFMKHLVVWTASAHVDLDLVLLELVDERLERADDSLNIFLSISHLKNFSQKSSFFLPRKSWRRWWSWRWSHRWWGPFRPVGARPQSWPRWSSWRTRTSASPTDLPSIRRSSPTRMLLRDRRRCPLNNLDSCFEILFIFQKKLLWKYFKGSVS